MNINENTVCAFKYVLNTTTLFSQESGRHGGLMQDKRRVNSQGTENAGLSGVIQGIGLGNVVACCCLTKTLIYFLRLYLALLPQLSHQIHLVIAICGAPLSPNTLSLELSQSDFNKVGE